MSKRTWCPQHLMYDGCTQPTHSTDTVFTGPSYTVEADCRNCGTPVKWSGVTLRDSVIDKLRVENDALRKALRLAHEALDELTFYSPTDATVAARKAAKGLL